MNIGIKTFNVVSCDADTTKVSVPYSLKFRPSVFELVLTPKVLIQKIKVSLPTQYVRRICLHKRDRISRIFCIPQLYGLLTVSLSGQKYNNFLRLQVYII